VQKHRDKFRNKNSVTFLQVVLQSFVFLNKSKQTIALDSKPQNKKTAIHIDIELILNQLNIKTEDKHKKIFNNIFEKIFHNM
jgi:hypothetical protein